MQMTVEKQGNMVDGISGIWVLIALGHKQTVSDHPTLRTVS